MTLVQTCVCISTASHTPNVLIDIKVSLMLHESVPKHDCGFHAHQFLVVRQLLKCFVVVFCICMILLLLFSLSFEQLLALYNVASVCFEFQRCTACTKN